MMESIRKKKLALIKEGKIPVDRRVALTPAQAKQVKELFQYAEVVSQRSPIRCYRNHEYMEAGIEVVDEVKDCDILIGIKEVPVADLIPEKTYLFFSHTIKKQPHNKKLLQEILKKKIRLIDYECITDLQGNRLIAFGKYAGIVGAYNGILAYGRRYKFFDLRRARDCFDMADLQSEYKKIKLPPIKMAVTGGGRVASGAISVLDGMGITKVAPRDYLTRTYDFPVYTQLRSEDYHLRKDGKSFEHEDFYKNPSTYFSDFKKYTRVTDLLIACAYWNPSAPLLFTKEDMQTDEFKIKVIADITCDINGSIPCTKRPSSIDDPIYDYNPAKDSIEIPLSGDKNVTVMAIDNLPCELPRDASHSFGENLIKYVLPNILTEDTNDIIKRATIAENGKLTAPYQYLSDYISG